MKYLFHVHSYTCYITSLGVIKTENLSKEDVTFLICRGLPVIDNDIKHVYMDDHLYYQPYFTNKQLTSFKFLKSKKYIKQVDKIIDNNFDEKFVYYVHNSRNYLYRIVISHPLCEEVQFIEDGLDMYLDEVEFDRKYPRKVRLRHKVINFFLGKLLGVYDRLMQVDDPFANKSGERHIYGLTDYSFAKFIDEDANYHKVDTEYIRKAQEFLLPKGTNLFVFSALVEQHITTQPIINDFLRWFVNKFQITELSVNFHPHQSEDVRNEIITILKEEGIIVNVVPDEVVMEILFINNDDINVYGIGTSLLIYATYFMEKAKVHSLYPYFEKHLNLITPRTKYWANTYESINKNNFYLYGRDFT